VFDLSGINWLAVIVAAVAHVVIGAIWYGPLFGARWQAATGRTQAEMGSGMSAIAISAVASLVMAAALALLLTALNTVDLPTGLAVGVLAGVGFVGTSTVINGSFENRAPLVTGLFVAYEVIAIAVMGAILGAWQ
jgi:hypothetical protein